MGYIEDKNKILTDIREMKNGSYEQMLLITMYSLNSYFKSLVAFGKNHAVTRDNINIIKEMFGILKNERTLLNYIVKHIDEFDMAATENIVAILDEANDEAVYFYYDVIDDIEEAAEMRQEFRAIRRKQKTPTLIQSDSYAKQVIALGENLDKLKEFLGFEDEFWQFIKDDTKEINFEAEIEMNMVHATPLLDEKGNVARILIVAPKVVNLESALLAIKIYIKAHDIYMMLGHPYNKTQLDDSTSKVQDSYENDYLLRKVQDTFKR